MERSQNDAGWPSGDRGGKKKKEYVVRLLLPYLTSALQVAAFYWLHTMTESIPWP